MSDEMGIFEVMYNCRAMRRLDTREVEEEKLMKLVQMLQNLIRAITLLTPRFL